MWMRNTTESKLKLKNIFFILYQFFYSFFELEQHGMFDIERKSDFVFSLVLFSSIKKLLICVLLCTLIARLVDFTFAEKKHLLEKEEELEEEERKT